MITLLLSLSLQTSAILRDENGRIHRDRTAVEAFKRMHPCPPTGKGYGSCKGFVVDHIIPLCYGGLDKPENMQWQEYFISKKKDVLENKLCKNQLTLQEYMRRIAFIR
jgi:hypothetical protein